ncbi:MAG: hypothetical protein COA69_08560 [Robiginitomaculum sp.]|nr:MAG: hypothetical protein COA69_08560 [Robiginitomaculum sp.]
MPPDIIPTASDRNMTIPKTEPPPLPDLNGIAQKSFPDVQDLLPMLLGQTDVAPNGCDVETYLEMMDKDFAQVPESDRRELIHYLWNLCETVIGVQFGVDPVQVALSSQKNTAPQNIDSMVNLPPQPHITFKHAATDNSSTRQKG